MGGRVAMALVMVITKDSTRQSTTRWCSTPKVFNKQNSLYFIECKYYHRTEYTLPAISHDVPLSRAFASDATVRMCVSALTTARMAMRNKFAGWYMQRAVKYIMKYKYLWIEIHLFFIERACGMLPHTHTHTLRIAHIPRILIVQIHKANKHSRIWWNYFAMYAKRQTANGERQSILSACYLRENYDAWRARGNLVEITRSAWAINDGHRVCTRRLR